MFQDDLAKKFQDLKELRNRSMNLSYWFATDKFEFGSPNPGRRAIQNLFTVWVRDIKPRVFNEGYCLSLKTRYLFRSSADGTIRKAHPRRAPCDVESFVFKDERRGSKWIPLLLLPS